MKNIYMIQPNSQYGDSIYFPYAAGCLVAYAFQNETIRNAFRFVSFVWKKGDIDDQVSQIRDPFLIGFSCYVWNYEYNKEFARRVKARWPDCKIVFGGHQVNASSEVVTADYVDYVLLGEGEAAFEKLLLYSCGEAKLEEVPNLIYKKDGKPVRSQAQVTDFSEHVSPYCEGYFDDLIEQEELSFSAILETNRGCPNRCAFCDWGNIKSKIKMFDLDVVKKEIDWCSEHRIEYVYAADANFGMFRRDEAIVDYLIEKHRQTGYPQKFQATYAKNKPEQVFLINKKLNDAGMSKGATLSFQSMSENVLNNIYRKNMPLSSFMELMTRYTDSGIHAYSEIILSLPGESYDSFAAGVDALLESGQHQSINFFNCEMLANSGMNKPDYIEQYQIKTTRIQQHQYHVHPNDSQIEEYSDIVTSTSTLSEDDWVSMNILSVYVRTFHNLGLLQCFAIMLFYERHIKYSDFYKALIAFSKNPANAVCHRVYVMLEQKYRQILTGHGSLSCYFEEFGELTWPLEEGAFLQIIKDYDAFYEEIVGFFAAYFDVNSTRFRELLAYQKAIVKNPHHKRTELTLHDDFPAYFRNAYSNRHAPLEQRNMRILIDEPDIPSDYREFAKKIVWFGRKGGQNIVTDFETVDGTAEGEPS